jgi:hypothetical protein
MLETLTTRSSGKVHPPSCLPGRSTGFKHCSFDRSITDFAERYADQNERDYQQFVTAIQAGQLAVVEGV